MLPFEVDLTEPLKCVGSTCKYFPSYRDKYNPSYRDTTTKLSIKFDEANQIIGALRFENNFLAEKTKKLEVEQFQVKAQLERTSSAKLDEMLNLQKSAFDRTSLGYGFSSSNIASTSTIVFCSS